ncbi:Patatin-like serine hydrolase [Penicillium cf. griseofulvum]|nr:Patatin-like serine hydrolase [Penicillium cf. griseofulvum]
MKVSQLYVYPVKSLRPTTITEGILTTRGFQYDRHFMLLKVEDSSGSSTLKNMHVPHFPEMALFHTNIEYPQTEKDSGKLIITYSPPLSKSDPKHEITQLEIPLQPNTKSLKPLKVIMHQSPTTGYNMGTEYNDWFSACFGYPVVLAYLGPNSREVLGTLGPAKQYKKSALRTILESITRPDRKWERVLPIIIVASAINILLQGGTLARDGITPQTAHNLTSTILFTASAAVLMLVLYYFYSLRALHEDRITFADCAPYLVISETSVDNVSARLPAGEEMDRTKFRPNIVISGAREAFEEDFWGALTVGAQLGCGSSKLLLTGNCVRCQSLNVDYETGKMGTGESGAVLKKLMKDRRVDSGAKFSPVFDGGGVRGYSMLILLQELMYRTYVECEGKPPRRDQIPKPCDHFDLIAGTGTGGLIALMLGRLRLDLETCKEVYVRMTRKVFETDKTIAGIPYRSTLFKASKLEEAIRECVREHTIFEAEGNDTGNAPNRESMASMASLPYSPASIPQRSISRGSFSTAAASHPMSPTSQRGSVFLNGLRWGNPDALLYDNRENRTKTAVTAMYKGTPRKGSAVLLRSYDSRREPPPEFDCTVWQAGRATSATGLAFKPIQIGQHHFIDEGHGTFNPAPLILDEAIVNEWPGREVGVFVSVGTGKRPAGTNNRQHEWWEDFFGDSFGTFAEARRRLMTKIEGCEDIHNEMLRDRLAKRNVSKDNYFRLNVEVGVGEFGMNEWNRLADISTNTRQYLARPEVGKMILEAGVRFAKIERMNRRLATHAAAGGDRDDLSFDLENEELSLSPPIQSHVPPPAHFAVELPAELPAEFVDFAHHHPSQAPPPIPTVVTTSPPDDTLSVHPTPQDSISTSPRRQSGSDYRRSHELASRPSSQQQSSPSHSDEYFTFNGIAPPVPPKTPIPYPAQDDGGVAMPAPLFSQAPSNSNIKARPPYPVDEPPPTVNRQRKPSYHVR